MRPDTSYALDGDVHIAYQVLGTGSRDLLLVPEFWHSIEAQWELPELAAFLERLAGLGRLICFDQRGSGLSDPIALDEVPSLELWMNDIRVVLEAVGSERATLVAFGGGVATSVLYAAANPQRVPALVLVNGYARVMREPDYPHGLDEAARQDVRDVMTSAWGRGAFLDRLAPSRLDDEDFRRWWARSQRLGASPGSVVAQFRVLEAIDVRGVLPSIQAPTLVVAREEEHLDSSGARSLSCGAHSRRGLCRHAGARLLPVHRRLRRQCYPPSSSSCCVRRTSHTTPIAFSRHCSSPTSSGGRRRRRPNSAIELGPISWRRHHDLVQLRVEDAGGKVVDTVG